MKLLVIFFETFIIASLLQVSCMGRTENTCIMPENMHHDAACYKDYLKYVSSLKHGIKPQVGKVFKLSVTRRDRGLPVATGHPDVPFIYRTHDRILVVVDTLDQTIAWLDYDSHIHTFSEFLIEFEPYFDFSKLTPDSADCFYDSDRYRNDGNVCH